MGLAPSIYGQGGRYLTGEVSLLTAWDTAIHERLIDYYGHLRKRGFHLPSGRLKRENYIFTAIHSSYRLRPK